MAAPASRTAVALAAAGAALLLLLAADVELGGPLSAWDDEAAAAVGATIPPQTRHLVFEKGVSAPGDTLALAAVAAAAALGCWRLGSPRRAALAAAAFLACQGTVTLLKGATDRPRPFAGGTATDAFPSGHAAGTLLAYTLAAFLLLRAWEDRRGPAPAGWRRAVLAAGPALGLAVGLARLLAGVHWPTDVLAGWALGTAFLGLFLALDGRTSRGGRPPAAGVPYEGPRARRPVRVIGFTGMPGSGKSEAMEVAKARGIGVVRMGDLIWEEVDRRGLPRDAQHVGEVANQLRASHGKDVWARRTVERVRQRVPGEEAQRPRLAGAGGPAPVDEARPRSARLVLIDGIRSIEEVEAFRRELGHDFTLVAIHTDPDHRFQRMVRRGRADDSRDPAVLKARDEREMTWGIARTIALADEMLVNDGTLAEFRRRVGDLLDRLARA